MDYIPSFPLSSISQIGDKEKAYNDLINIIVKLANYGLVHGDFNEFNILVDDNQKMYIIDFPQVISIDHEEAEHNFNRDLKCIHDFFWKKYCVNFEGKPDFHKDIKRVAYLDVELGAYGCKKIKKEKERKKKDKKDNSLDDVEDLNSDGGDFDNKSNNSKNSIEKMLNKVDENHKLNKVDNNQNVESMETVLDKHLELDLIKYDNFINIDSIDNVDNKLKDLDVNTKKDASNITQIKDNTIKVIKKGFKQHTKSNRFKNKKKEKLKNALDY